MSAYALIFLVSKQRVLLLEDHMTEFTATKSPKRVLCCKLCKYTMLYADWVQPIDTPSWSIFISVKIYSS